LNRFFWRDELLSMEAINLIREFGLPTALLLLILLAAGVGLRWAAKQIVTPFVQAHLDLVSHLRDSLSEQTTAHARLNDEINANRNEDKEDHEKILQLLGWGKKP
jgi:hypothetical protein